MTDSDPTMRLAALRREWLDVLHPKLLDVLHRGILAYVAAHPRTTACTMFAAGVALTLFVVGWL